MPTTSVAGSFLLSNLGEVTSTFTAPSSCATHWRNNYHAVGLDGMRNFAFIGSCDIPFDHIEEDCFPQGEKLRKLDVEQRQSRQTNPFYGLATTQVYFSPAYACPSGWETAGVAAMSNGTASINGIFMPTATVVTKSGSVSGPTVNTDSASYFPSRDWPANMLTSALGPLETAILCCPRYVCPEYPLGG